MPSCTQNRIVNKFDEQLDTRKDLAWGASVRTQALCQALKGNNRYLSDHGGARASHSAYLYFVKTFIVPIHCPTYQRNKS
jgi:hypothetical protein